MKVYPKVPDPWAHTRWIRLKLKDGRKTLMKFKIKKNTQLRVLMEEYCTPLGLRLRSVRFTRGDGKRRIYPSDTAWALGLESGELIRFFPSDEAWALALESGDLIRFER